MFWKRGPRFSVVVTSSKGKKITRYFHSKSGAVAFSEGYYRKVCKENLRSINWTPSRLAGFVWRKDSSDPELIRIFQR